MSPARKRPAYSHFTIHPESLPGKPLFYVYNVDTCEHCGAYVLAARATRRMRSAELKACGMVNLTTRPGEFSHNEALGLAVCDTCDNAHPPEPEPSPEPLTPAELATNSPEVVARLRGNRPSPEPSLAQVALRVADAERAHDSARALTRAARDTVEQLTQALDTTRTLGEDATRPAMALKHATNALAHAERAEQWAGSMARGLRACVSGTVEGGRS